VPSVTANLAHQCRLFSQKRTGDFTLPSRFVRAVAFSESVLPSQIGYGAILQAFHILNDFDIPKGVSRAHDKDEHGNVVADYTIWTSASDLKAERFHFRSYENSENPRGRSYEAGLGGKDIVTWSMKADEVVRIRDTVTIVTPE
jgi:choloylglycine hydrolase